MEVRCTPRIVASILENNQNYRWNLEAKSSFIIRVLIGFNGELIKNMSQRRVDYSPLLLQYISSKQAALNFSSSAA